MVISDGFYGVLIVLPCSFDKLNNMRFSSYLTNPSVFAFKQFNYLFPDLRQKSLGSQSHKKWQGNAQRTIPNNEMAEKPR
jgi:hypothetical protein